MATGVKCRKCGLVQMARPTCKACGAVLIGSPASPTPPRELGARPEAHQTRGEPATREDTGKGSGLEEHPRHRAAAREGESAEESIYETKGPRTIGKSELFGIIGSITLFVGVFAPIVRMPVLGSINYFRNGRGDGAIVMALAVISFILTLLRKFKALWFTGFGSLGALIFTFVAFQVRMSETRSTLGKELAGNPFAGLGDLAGELVQLEWGWALLVVGAGLVITAAALERERGGQLQRVMPWLRETQAVLAHRIKPSDLLTLGVALILIVVTMYMVLPAFLAYSRRPGPTPDPSSRPRVGVTAEPFKPGVATPANPSATGAQKDQEHPRSEPDHARRLYALGKTQAQQGQTDEAIASYQDAVRLKPDYADAWNNLGLAYHKRGQFREALSAFQKLVRLEPTNEKGWILLGMTLDDDGQRPRAIEAVHEAIRLNPNEARAWMPLGYIYRRDGQLAKGIQAFREVVRLEPDSREARILLGVMVREQESGSK